VAACRASLSYRSTNKKLLSVMTAAGVSSADPQTRDRRGRHDSGSSRRIEPAQAPDCGRTRPSASHGCLALGRHVHKPIGTNNVIRYLWVFSLSRKVLITKLFLYLERGRSRLLRSGAGEERNALNDYYKSSIYQLRLTYSLEK
jgi:hypothetical protein